MADYNTIANPDGVTPFGVEDADAFLSEAREYYKMDLACDQEDRESAEDDNRFANAGDSTLDQWDPVALALRRQPGFERPIQQWNRIPTYVQQVVNDGRQNKPAIKIAPADGGLKETAEFFQGRIRQIEYESNADIAYDTARDQQVTSGRGFIRVHTEWIPGEWKQRICISPIENQFSVVWDASSKLYDRSDAERCFVVTRISKAKHIRDYGKDSVVSQMDWDSYENPAPTWIGIGDKRDQCQIAEYWCKEYKKRRLLEMAAQGAPPIPVWKDALTDEQYRTFKANGQIVNERDEQDCTVIQYVINGAEILSKCEWEGSTIPIVPVWGRMAVVDGKRRTFSLIRNAKDPQRLVNLYVSNIAEQIAQMPKSPYLVPAGGIAAAHEKFWANAANSPLSYLYYMAFDPQGRPLPPPSRVVNEPPIQALTIGLQQAIEGIKAAMGIYDASLGARSNETSGIAIDQRRKSAEVVNFHFPDNEARSRKRIGQILMELIPIVDKPGGEATIRLEDGKTRNVPIGVEHQDPKTGQPVTHNLTEGDYGVAISSGPSYTSQRQAEFERDVELVKADPTLMWVIGDQLFASDDAPGSQERAERMRRAIALKTPGLVDAEDQQRQPIPPELQAQIAKLQQDKAATEAFAQSLHEKLQTDAVKRESDLKLKQMDLDFQREKLAAETQQKLVDSEIKGLMAGVQVDIASLRGEIETIKHESGQTHQSQMAEAQRQHDAQQSAAGREHQTATQAADQQHAAEMADTAHQQTLEQQENAAAVAPQPEQGAE